MLFFLSHWITIISILYASSISGNYSNDLELKNMIVFKIISNENFY